MKININNYEAFFLDYHEGRLTPHEVAELMVFLEEHPELQEVFGEFEDFSVAEMESGDIVFEGKEGLKRTTLINRENYEQYFVASVEDELNEMERKELGQFLAQHPQMEHELELYRKTRLVPDKSIVYENKHELKRGQRKPVFWYYAAAASIALLISLFFIFNKPAQPDVIVNNQPVNTNTEQPSKTPANVTAATEDQVAVESPPGNERRNSNDKINRKELPVQQPLKDKLPELVQDDLRDLVQHPPVIDNKKQVILPVLEEQDNVLSVNDADAGEDDVELVKDNSSGNYLTLRQLVAKKVKISLLNNDAVVADASSKITSWDFLHVALKGYRKITGRETEMKKEYSEDGQMIAYGFSAGKFEFSRSGRK